MNELRVHLVSWASRKKFPQNTLHSIKNYFKEKIILEGIGELK